jgi:hypothetical protein
MEDKKVIIRGTYQVVSDADNLTIMMFRGIDEETNNYRFEPPEKQHRLDCPELVLLPSELVSDQFHSLQEGDEVVLCINDAFPEAYIVGSLRR